ncbi:MAG: hypothetical protein H6622_06670 [Halobacteriovoraceae bacterium]|nr:hypothetical protein [Halobacteriovoraceae bacterium]
MKTYKNLLYYLSIFLIFASPVLSNEENFKIVINLDGVLNKLSKFSGPNEFEQIPREKWGEEIERIIFQNKKYLGSVATYPNHNVHFPIFNLTPSNHDFLHELFSRTQLSVDIYNSSDENAPTENEGEIQFQKKVSYIKDQLDELTRSEGSVKHFFEYITDDANDARRMFDVLEQSMEEGRWKFVDIVVTTFQGEDSYRSRSLISVVNPSRRIVLRKTNTNDASEVVKELLPVKRYSILDKTFNKSQRLQIIERINEIAKMASCQENLSYQN